MSPVNEAIPFYEDGDDITGHCSAPVTGKSFVKISGPRINAISPVNDAITGGNVQVALCTGGGDISFGIAVFDQVAGGKVPVKRGRNYVMPVIAGAALNAGQEVMPDVNGHAVPYDGAAGHRASGLCLDDTAAGADAPISQY